jgi:hypothetical protein
MKFFKTNKIKTLVVLCLLCFGIFSQDVSANSLIGKGKNCDYITEGLYQPFSDINQGFPVFGRLMDGICINVSTRVNDMFAYGFQVFLGLVSLIAVVQVSVAGIQWMVQDTKSNILGKTTAKQKLTNSIIGLVLALSSWLILYAVNPRILAVNLNFAGGGPLGRAIQEGVRQSQNIAPVDAGKSGELVGGFSGGEVLQGTTGKPAGATGTSEGGQSGGSSSGGVSKFTNAEWANYTRQKIESSGLNNLSPADAAKFFPNGTPTTDGWLRIFEEVIERESSFQPGNVYYETGLGYNSVGLLQLSQGDSIVKRKGYSEADLKDPYKNIDAGVDIFTYLVKRDGCISCGTKGGAAYWSVLRTPDVHQNGKLNDIINAVNQ